MIERVGKRERRRRLRRERKKWTREKRRGRQGDREKEQEGRVSVFAPCNLVDERRPWGASL